MTSSEPVGVITILFLPPHPFGHAPKFTDGAPFAETHTAVQYVNLKFLARPDFKEIADTLRYNDLILRRDFNDFHESSNWYCIDQVIVSQLVGRFGQWHTQLA